MALDERLMDKRLVGRNRNMGLVTDEEIAAYKKKLPDGSDLAEWLPVGSGDQGAKKEKPKR
ncbi:MAG: hypothetical protein QME96_08530 [Myxococcota bacterium]|nr:hypothetical protein [Myxococcota bacterium]